MSINITKRDSFILFISFGAILSCSYLYRNRNIMNNADINKKRKKITRNESEFSLGLTRNESIAKALCEFGEMCSTGKILFGFIRTSGLVCLAYFSYIYIVNSKHLKKLYE
mmetsp:Transcript_776/g.678  ORF Transcript_776/g.678 Transcript_776/m.678 type:complete len:111 (-) Transcript_776:211-543(-)